MSAAPETVWVITGQFRTSARAQACTAKPPEPTASVPYIPSTPAREHAENVVRSLDTLVPIANAAFEGASKQAHRDHGDRLPHAVLKELAELRHAVVTAELALASAKGEIS